MKDLSEQGRPLASGESLLAWYDQQRPSFVDRASRPDTEDEVPASWPRQLFAPQQAEPQLWDQLGDAERSMVAS